MKKILITLLFLFIPLSVFANEKVNIYVFHNYNCPHCHDALEYLNELIKEDTSINVYEFELLKDNHALNRTKYLEICNLLKINVRSVPLIIIGNDYYIGFSNSKKEEINKAIDFYKKNDYKDTVGIALEIVDDNNNPIIKQNDENKEYSVDTIFGKINLKDLSLPIISIIIGLVDGFNPCAMWILLFLITMLFNMKNKRKMWILGITFIGTSGFIYFAFMMAWINIGDYLNSVHTFQVIIGIFASIFGTYNIYKFYKERQNDGCNVIKKEKRKFVFNNIKKIVENKSFVLAIIGIMFLAILVNLVELLCSLGLPVMYTEILTINQLGESEYIRYVLLYILFFLIDDIIVFVISMITLKSTAISTKYNKYSHLIGGIIMLLIGILIIFKPEWLSFNFN